MTSPFSVIIPAHNEASVVRRCLEALLSDAPAESVPEIVVVANGCSDETAAIARSVSPAVKVIELAIGSKTLALNTGNAAATAVPRFFLDADVTVSFVALEAVAQKLRNEDFQAAAPQIRLCTDGCDWLVKSYCATWITQPYIRNAMVGSGLYGLSREGLDTVGTFPSIIADDAYVRTRFKPEQRCSVSMDGRGLPAYFTVFPPRRVRDLIRIEARRRAGDAELHELYPSAFSEPVTSAVSLGRASGDLRDKMVYLAIKGLGRLRFQVERKLGRHKVWHRDESSRV